MINKVYENQLITVKDLEIRDRVISKIKDAFYKASERDYPK